MRDKAWVNRILNGDKAAGERLVAENYQRVYGMLRSLAGNADTAEDLTQQAFVRAWQALPGFRGDARLSTWLYRIAYHEYTHWLRDRRECAPLEEADKLPDPKAIVGLRTVMFTRATEQISPELRETFLLHYEQDLSVKEIAVVLEVPPGTVKSRLYTARHRLRQILSAPPGEQDEPARSHSVMENQTTPRKPSEPALLGPQAGTPALLRELGE